ncbi:MAG: hypothetical protein DHS20C01_13740 [marine bacterium B5-7]|nr:MAG: hypothetical protein DHS20C01_13740 [marine bacterium B5-7]
MWIELSKILPYLVYPLTVVIVLAVAGCLAFLMGGYRSGRILVLLSVLFLLIASNPWLASRFRAHLEQWYLPVEIESVPKSQAIVLLAGALQPPVPPRLVADLTGASDRIWQAARLYRAGRAPLVIVTGGNVFKQDDTIHSEAWYIAELLNAWGVPQSAVIIEEDSRNTHENAVFTRKILDRRGILNILLVTSALHMPRALATFKGAGINAIPVSVDFTVAEYRQPLVLKLLPSAGALAANTETLREYLGILIYGMRGWLATGPDDHPN